MKEWCGWAGTVLRVDLESGEIKKQPLTRDKALTYLGSRGFNQKTLWDEIRPGIDPLGPENVLSIGVGPLNGTIFPCSGRYSMSYKSPWTGILGDGNALTVREPLGRYPSIQKVPLPPPLKIEIDVVDLLLAERQVER